MNKFKAAFLMLVVLILLVMALPAGAITDGELDGDGHPHVVLLLTEVDGRPAWRCSATMLTPYVVLTAGHCVSNYPDDGEVTGARIFIESDVDAGRAAGTNNYPFGDGTADTSREAASWAAHPLYETAPFYFNDVGVVVLAEPYYVPGGVYGTLPAQDSLDALKPNSHTRFTAVGYGLQEINPAHIQANKVRMVANPHLVQINVPGFTGDFSLLLSNNHSSGGTCFGDSGGPNFLGNSNVVAGVTSFGLNGTCGGTGGVFRMDRANVLEFVGQFLD